MRRIRLRSGPSAIFGAAFVIALILLLPMRLALSWIGLSDNGLSARSAQGSVWAGSLTEARVSDIDLGDLKARLSPVQLLIGRARVDLVGRDSGPGTALHGAIGITRHSFGIDDLTATLPGGTAFAPVPVAQLDLDDVSVRFRDGTCERAEGRVRATLAGTIGAITLPQAMSGTARCQGDTLLLPLASAAGTEAIALKVRQDGHYVADLTMRPSDPAIAQKLQLSGFQQSPAGYTLSIQGGL